MSSYTCLISYGCLILYREKKQKEAKRSKSPLWPSRIGEKNLFCWFFFSGVPTGESYWSYGHDIRVSTGGQPDVSSITNFWIYAHCKDVSHSWATYTHCWIWTYDHLTGHRQHYQVCYVDIQYHCYTVYVYSKSGKL